jgi:3-mercaptopyruvate sulfurtransferase SseA
MNNNSHTSNVANEKKVVNSTILGAKDYELPVVCDIDILRTLIRNKAARVVDVRKEEEYKQGHIPTAVSIPLAQVLSKDSPEGIVDILEYWSFR